MCAMGVLHSEPINFKWFLLNAAGGQKLERSAEHSTVNE